MRNISKEKALILIQKIQRISNATGVLTPDIQESLIEDLEEVLGGGLSNLPTFISETEAITAGLQLGDTYLLVDLDAETSEIKTYAKSLDFNTSKSGNFGDLSIWKYLVNGSRVQAPVLPNILSDVYLTKNTKTTVIENTKVKDLWLNLDEDVNRLDLKANLEMYGTLRWYSGDDLDDPASSGGAVRPFSITFMIVGDGEIVIKGKSRELLQKTPIEYSTGSPTTAGFNLRYAIDSGEELTITGNMRQGQIIYDTPGAIYTHDDSSRIWVAKDTDGTIGGDVIVKSGVIVSSPSRYYRANNLAINSFTLEAGSTIILTNASFTQLGTYSYDLKGKVVIDGDGFFWQYGDGVEIEEYADVNITTTNLTINLRSPITRINGDLTISSPNTSNFTLNGHSLFYGEDSNITYDTNDRDQGDEIPELGLGSGIPKDLIVDGVTLTLTKDINIRGSIVLLNGGTIDDSGGTYSVNENVNTENVAFRSVSSGDWGDASTWEVESEEGTFYPTFTIPDETNPVGIQANTKVSLDQEASCLNIFFNTNNDDIRFDTRTFKLNVSGKMALYTGDFDATTTGTTGFGAVAGWIRSNKEGGINFIGSADRTIVASDEFDSAGNNKGFNIFVSFDPGFKATIANNVRCWDLYCISGITEILTGSMRPSGPWNGDDIDGAIYVSPGATFILDGPVFNSSLNPIELFSLPLGAIMEVPAGDNLDAQRVLNKGEIKFTQAGNQNFIGTGKAESQKFDEYYIVSLEGSGSKIMTIDFTVKRKMKLNGVATLNLGGSYTLSYADAADLEYTASATAGVELPASGSGSQIPNNLIVPTGETLDLDGKNVNIRGTLQGGGTTTNGTLNENQL